MDVDHCEIVWMLNTEIVSVDVEHCEIVSVDVEHCEIVWMLNTVRLCGC